MALPAHVWREAKYDQPSPAPATTRGPHPPLIPPFFSLLLNHPPPPAPTHPHTTPQMFWQCSARPGYNTTCPPGGMGKRVTPSYQTINRSLEAAVPLMDAQIADQAVATLDILRNRAATAAAAVPWFLAVGFHLPHRPDLVPERFVDLYPDPVGLPEDQAAPRGMPAVAWSSSDELRQYSDVRTLPY